MEISRLTSGKSTATEAVASSKTATPGQTSANTTRQETAPEPRLEQLQEAMRALPEIDMDQVVAIKQALARGDLTTDVKVLAHSILAYHRSSDL